jgi:hypothetical protein
VVIIIDEAQNLQLDVLEELRMLSNFETEKAKLLQIVLVGQPELRDTLRRPELEQLRQRITVRFHLHPLGEQETRSYIQHRLRVAGSSGKVRFTAGASRLVHDYAQGLPRLINVACDAVLLAGFVEERRVFSEPFARDALVELADERPGITQESTEPPRAAPASGGRRRGIVVAVVAAVLALGLIGVLVIAQARSPEGVGGAWQDLINMFRAP